MDESPIIPGNADHASPRVFPIPSGEESFHRAFGLRLIFMGRGVRYPAKTIVKPRCFRYFSISKLVEGRGWFWRPGAALQYFNPGFGALAVPAMVMDYGGCRQGYVEDHLCFYGPAADCLYRQGLIPGGVISFGPEHDLAPIIEMGRRPDARGQLAASMALLGFLRELYLWNQSRPNAPEERVQNLMRSVSQRPGRDWSVTEMAFRCHLSESHFRRLFRSLAGMPPRDYLESSRVRLAVEKLRNVNASVTAIAGACGYHDPFYFSKVFKKQTGLTPSQFRQKYQA